MQVLPFSDFNVSRSVPATPELAHAPWQWAWGGLVQWDTRKTHTKVTYNSPCTHGKTEFLSQRNTVESTSHRKQSGSFYGAWKSHREKTACICLFASNYQDSLCKRPLALATGYQHWGQKKPSHRGSMLGVGACVQPWLACKQPTSYAIYMDLSAFGTVQR